MYAPGALLYGEVVFRQPQSPAGESSGTLGEGHEPPEGIMVRPDGELGPFNVRP